MNVHANKLEAEFKFNTFNRAPACTSKGKHEKVWKEKTPEIVRLFEPHPSLAGCCPYIRNSTVSVHTPVMFKPQQASQQTQQRFFTLQVQRTASKGTTTHNLLEKRCSFVNEGVGWPGSVVLTKCKQAGSTVYLLRPLCTVSRQA
jgi:hypothetical protein